MSNQFRQQLADEAKQLATLMAGDDVGGEILVYTHRANAAQNVVGFPESGGDAAMRVTEDTRSQEELRAFQIPYQTTDAVNYTPTGASWGGGTATLTIGAHSSSVGDVVTVTGMDPIGYDGQDLTITAIGSTTISYAVASDPGAFVAGGNAQTGRPFPPTDDDVLIDDTIQDIDGKVYIVRRFNNDALQSVVTFPDCAYTTTKQVGAVGQ